ncbi:dienelactone hydrolase family protein [Novosphingobium sp. TH158]|uniref:dienelactone hydrolase family protein n=1 Tax=Novosphingobium sp. TH158 TaxID=2067455 RepID=UPI000C7A2FEE|nr:dienelactone hydrolase family protein [Novosphingobium sp. TH158]PLK24431.1 dienelactone hydrolase [Novosphingobium sp. TH158]
MCDDFTLEAEQAALSRRAFGLASGAAVVAAGSGGAAAFAKGKALAEAKVMVPTADGSCDCLFVHPAKGRHPGVIFWPDIGGAREAKYAMARQLAAHGYAVLVVNQYYRAGKAPVLNSFSEWRTPEGQAKLKPMIATVTPEGVARDAKAFVAWLDRQKAVNPRRGIGSQGYCMGGPFTVRTAAAAPDRVRAAASFHGGGLVGDKPDSPSQLLKSTKAGYLFAIARNDDARAPGEKDALKAAAAAARVEAEIEVYGGDHGWTVPDSPVYNKAEADRAFARLLALYARL